MKDYAKDERVDSYINMLPAWQQTICQRVRELVHQADTDVQETIKRRVQPYFVLNGNICALLAASDHVNVFIYDPSVNDPHKLINQGHSNATAQSIQIHKGDSFKESALLEMFKEIVSRNRLGGWRKLNQNGKD